MDGAVVYDFELIFVDRAQGCNMVRVHFPLALKDGYEDLNLRIMEQFAGLGNLKLSDSQHTLLFMSEVQLDEMQRH